MKKIASDTSQSSYCSSSSKDSHKSYKLPSEIKYGLQKAIPAAIVVWPFHHLPSAKTKTGLRSKYIINYLKKYYKVSNDPSRTGKALGTMLRGAVKFGLLNKRGSRYFLPQKKRVPNKNRKFR